ncbi:hypothetical protein QAD02_006844 [Eretmocerus hayati]|uniref:Uncharacterized protein n=1 Tax=Eretmocerus hayati TaxID=131215 RepID=A0ACC2N2C3_9HYME|nr:hypothetical protein QAD02_006844 [Eretmocerus hayati]
MGVDEMDPEAAFEDCIITICCNNDSGKVHEAWETLEDVFGCCSDYEKVLRSIFTELHISNIEEVPKILEWFLKVPISQTSSRPFSDDIAVFLTKQASMFRNKPSLLADIIRILKENQDDFLPAHNNHTELCKSIVHVLSWIHVNDKHPDSPKTRLYNEDLNTIIEFLHKLCKSNPLDGKGNISISCFKPLYQILIHSDRKEDPSSILVYVLKLVDDTLWNISMEVAAAHITEKASGPEILRMLGVMLKWLIQPPHDNMRYLSAWLMLFIKHLQNTGKNMRIPMELAESSLPNVLAPALQIEQFYEIETSQNILLHLMYQIISQNTYHKIIFKCLIPFLHECENVSGNKKEVVDAIFQISQFLKNRFREHLRNPCDLCNNLEKLMDKLSTGRPLDNCYEEMDTSYSSSTNTNARTSAGKAGLLNLGNTCYMNSVLQALVMTRQFCHEVLLYKSDTLNNQFVLKNLQQIFALLKYSTRNALAPTKFLQASRPSYFMPGQQQDSSEFLCHLLDVLYEQEKSTLTPKYNNHIAKKVKTEDVEMVNAEEVSEPSHSPMQEEGTGNMTRWTTEENLSEGASLQRKTQSLADFTQGEELAQTQNGLSDSHSDSADSGIQSVGGEDSTSSTTSSPSSPAGAISSLVHRVFGGELQVIYRCLKCDTESCNTDRFRDLQLCFLDSMPNEEVVKVQDLINANYTAPEELKGDNQYRCDKCACLRDATREIKFIQAPAHLILTLKHFRYDAESRLRTKQRRRVDYNEVVHLPVVDKDPAEYQLYAAVVHSGYSMDFGHYITYACDANKQWYKFNDGYVGETTIADFKRLQLPDTPYILFYKRRMSDESIAETLELSSLHEDLKRFVESDNHEYAHGKIKLPSTSLKRFGVRSWDRDKNDDDDEGNQPPSNCRSSAIIPNRTCLY